MDEVYMCQGNKFSCTSIYNIKFAVSRMAEDTSEEKVAPELSTASTSKKNDKSAPEPRRGILSRIWHAVFSRKNDDFEKRLEYLSKEEASVYSRLKRRAQTWRSISRNLIIYSVILEAAAVIYSIMTTRSLDLEWKMRAIRVIPIFVVPAFAAAIYSMLSSYNKMRDRSDQKTLERLRAERRAKIDELKERTNYYITQQLIQRYDTDPAAKAAAASVLASKLGVDSGLKVSIEDEPKFDLAHAKSSDFEAAGSTGLRNRKAAGSTKSQETLEEVPNAAGVGVQHFGSRDQSQTIAVAHHQRSAANQGGWVARVAAMLVGEDPTQCYALICCNCHMHNGLARKEDFPYITYYCPHCNALNGSSQQDPPASASGSQEIGPLPSIDSQVTINAAPESNTGLDSANLPEDVQASNAKPSDAPESS